MAEKTPEPESRAFHSVFNGDNPKILPGRACCNGAGVSPGAGCQSVGARLAAVEEFFGTIDDRVFKLMPYMS